MTVRISCHSAHRILALLCIADQHRHRMRSRDALEAGQRGGGVLDLVAGGLLGFLIGIG